MDLVMIFIIENLFDLVFVGDLISFLCVFILDLRLFKFFIRFILVELVNG